MVVSVIREWMRAPVTTGKIRSTANIHWRWLFFIKKTFYNSRNNKILRFPLVNTNTVYYSCKTAELFRYHVHVQFSDQAGDTRSHMYALNSTLATTYTVSSIYTCLS